MPFFTVDVEKDDAADVLARSLFQGLLKSRKVSKHAPRRGWAEHFRAAEREGRIDYPTAQRVMSWYVENIGGEFVPIAFSARTFIEKFDRIKNQMERQSKAVQQETFNAPRNTAVLFTGGYQTPQEYEELCRAQEGVDHPRWVDMSLHVVASYDRDLLSDDAFYLWKSCWQEYHSQPFPILAFRQAAQEAGLYETDNCRPLRSV